MTLSCTAVQVCRRDQRFEGPTGMRAAVSLHSHSSCSRETLTFIPQLAARIPLVATLFERSAARYAREYGRPLDFGSYYWRPPLSAAAVIASERENIERR